MRTLSTILLFGILWAPEPAMAQSAQERVTGAEIRFRLLPGRSEIRGELWAAVDDTLWVAPSAGDGPVPIAFPEIAGTDVRIRAHDAGSRWTGKWALLGWAATSAGLFGACKSVRADCTGVIVGTTIPWAVVGGIAAATNEGGTWRSFPRDEMVDLRPYGRFPQGLPEAARP